MTSSLPTERRRAKLAEALRPAKRRAALASAVVVPILVFAFVVIVASDAAPVRETLSALARTAQRIDDHRDRTGQLPHDLEELGSSYVAANRDGWDRPLIYRVEGDGFTLLSHGRDGILGGAILDRDLSPESRIRAVDRLAYSILERPLGWIVAIASTLFGLVVYRVVFRIHMPGNRALSMTRLTIANGFLFMLGTGLVSVVAAGFMGR